MQDLIYYRKFF